MHPQTKLDFFFASSIPLFGGLIKLGVQKAGSTIGEESRK